MPQLLLPKNLTITRIILIALGIAIILTAILALLYYLFAHPTPPAEPGTNPPTVSTPQPQQPSGQFPSPTTPSSTLPNAPSLPEGSSDTTQSSQQQGTKSLVDLPLLYTVHAPGSDTTIGYNPLTGQFLRIAGNGKTIPYSDRLFFNVSRVTWSRDSSQAVLEFPDGLAILYNFETKTQTNLPQHWSDFSFSPQGDRIAFKSIGLGSDENWLATAATDASDIRNIQPLGDEADRVHIDWSPTTHSIAVYAEPIEDLKQRLHFMTDDGSDIPDVDVRGLNAQGQWAPNGQYYLYNVADPTDDYRPHLWVVDPFAQETTHHKLPSATWSNKCVFAPARPLIYCAEPSILPSTSGLFSQPTNQPPEPDRLVEIDLNRGTKTTLDAPNLNWNIDQLSVANDGQTLIVHDKQSLSVHAIPLL